jgi:phosphate/sulfate permease
MALFLATHFGAAVSTIHTIIGAIIGVGAARSLLSAGTWQGTSYLPPS